MVYLNRELILLMKSTNCNSLCIHQLFEEQVSRIPDAIAVIGEHEQLTYQTLNIRSNQIAHYLRKFDIGADMPVALCMESSVDLIVSILGILKAGGGYVPLDSTYPSERIAYMLADSDSKVLLTQNRLTSRLPSYKVSLICVDAEWRNIENEERENLINHSSPDTLAYIIYTSGSTGRPKGIEMPHRAVVNLIEWQSRVTPVSDAAKTVQFAPISFDVSFQEIFSTLCFGGTLVLMPAYMRRDPDALLHFLGDAGIERIFLPPAALQQLAMVAIDSEVTLPHLKEIITAGDQLQIVPAIEDFFNNLPHCNLHNHYGPSETHVVTAFTLTGSPSTWPRLPSIGRAIDNNQIYLLDDTMQHVPVGNCGELYIGGVGLARGYVNRPELTESRFIPNPYVPGRLYKTGDLASQMPDGNFQFLGRSDHQVKIRGFRVELGEIETVLLQHPLVREAVVMPYEDKNLHKRLVAYIVAKAAGVSEAVSLAHAEQVQTWRRIWDEAYRSSTDICEDGVHLGGWNDSYTGGALPVAQVREWVTDTIARIKKIPLRNVLEIGCGTGLLLFKLAPECARYHGTDIAEQGLDYIRQRIRSTALEKIVTLQQVAADALDDIHIEPVDTIIINGVLQFFPGMEYFITVFARALRLLQSSGYIFIGDVQNHDLLELFHTSVQLSQASATLPTQELRQRIRTHVEEEKKLLFSPEVFTALPQRFPQISQVEIQLKRGYAQNELTRFRYDVILRVGSPVQRLTQKPTWKIWHSEMLTDIRHELAQCAPEFLGIAHVPNARLWTDAQAMNLLAGADAPQTAGELRNCLQPGGIEPEVWWQLETELPYRVYLCWSEKQHTACYDVLFQRHDSTEAITAEMFPAFREVGGDIEKPWAAYANNPLQSKEAFAPKLRHFLQQQLPEYMIPTSFIFMDELPLAPSGKLNRGLLPAPKSERPVLEQPFVMPLTAIEKQLAEIWAEMLNIQPIGRHDNFFDLGGHSLLILQLLAQIQETFQIVLPLVSLFEHPTLSGLGQAITAQRQNGQTLAALTVMTVSELETYARQDAVIALELSSKTSIETPPLKRIFLTGATGFIGAFLLDELLKQTNAEIYCLIRNCKTPTKAKQRIFQNMQHYGLRDFAMDETLHPRIIAVCGDLSQPSFGLSESEFDILAQELDMIYHLGAEVNLLYPYSALQAANVQGTREILRLAGHLRMKPVHYTSTMGIFESAAYVGQPPIPEQIRFKAEDMIYGGYAQSKWVAEQLLTTAQARGISITIYRPGAATGDSRTGVADMNHILLVLFRYFLQQNAIPKLNLPLDMTPVDYISQAIVYLSQQADSRGKVFHLVNPRPTSFIELADSLKELGYSPALTDYAEWLSTLRRMSIDSPENLFGAILPIFTDTLPNTHLTYLELSSIGMRFDCQQTIQGLSGSNIHCPPPDTRLLETYLTYLQSHYKLMSQHA